MNIHKNFNLAVPIGLRVEVYVCMFCDAIPATKSMIRGRSVIFYICEECQEYEIYIKFSDPTGKIKFKVIHK